MDAFTSNSCLHTLISLRHHVMMDIQRGAFTVGTNRKFSLIPAWSWVCNLCGLMKKQKLVCLCKTHKILRYIKLKYFCSSVFPHYVFNFTLAFSATVIMEWTNALAIINCYLYSVNIYSCICVNHFKCYNNEPLSNNKTHIMFYIYV